MKRILIAATAMMLVLAMLGAGTFAWWSDTETSEANTFATGTLGMVISDNNQPNYNGTPVTLSWNSPSDWYPGQKFSGFIELRNTGTTAIPYVEIDWKRPVSALGPEAADALANKIIITQFDEIVSNVRYNNLGPGQLFQTQVRDYNGKQDELTLLELARSYKIASEPYAATTPNKKTDDWSSLVDYVADTLTGSGYDQVSGQAIPVGATYRLEMTFQLDPLTGDEFQGKTIKMQIVFRGIQDLSQSN